MTRVALPPRLPLILTAASFGFTIVQLDVTIVNVALDAIGREFGAPTASLQWVVDAYTLLLAALLLSAGALGDRFGPRRAFLTGLVLFAVSSAACGLAQSSLQLILSRAIQGAAAALLVPPSLALITHAAAGDDRARAWAVGWWTAAGGVSIAAGPVIGGLLIGALGWRWVFLVNLPLCLLGAALTLAFVPEVPPREKRPLDIPGQVLGFVALACLVGAVIEGGHRGWRDPLAPGALVAGLAAAAAFLAVEMRSAHPAVPLEVFRDRMVWSAVVIGVGVNFTYYGVIFVLGLFLQRSAGYSVLQAGLAFLPLTATFIVSNLLSGRIAHRFGSARTMAGGVLVAAVGYALTSRLSPSTPFCADDPRLPADPRRHGHGRAGHDQRPSGQRRPPRLGHGLGRAERLPPSGRGGRCGGDGRPGGRRARPGRRRPADLRPDRGGGAAGRGLGGVAQRRAPACEGRLADGGRTKYPVFSPSEVDLAVFSLAERPGFRAAA
jgi:DHA2 family methylenomycin A resistance protein-like MFS transporter